MTTRTALVAAACLVFCTVTQARPRFAFLHPGMLHSRQDLERMKRAVASRAEPVFAGYEKLRVHPQSQADYVIQGPFEEIGRNPNVHFREFDQDANAAYQNAILWAVTGNRGHAAKAEAILDLWSGTLRRVSGADAVLMAGLGPFKMVNAAEILRHSGGDWPQENARRFGQLCRDVFYPVLKDFAEFANGNWDTAAIKTMLAMGVYLDDHAMFERALRYYVNGAGNGRLSHYIYDNGQCQESGRDQAHTQLGLGHLGDACEIAWQQGLDLYGYMEGRLLAGFEYTAQYNLNGDVPFVPDLDRTGKNAHRAISPRGPFRPVYEQIYNHFANRMGIAAPFTERAAKSVRPEGAAQGADHPGFGTLLFLRPLGDRQRRANTPPGAPAGLFAQAEDGGIRLKWIAPRGAATYTIKRSSRSRGPYRVVSAGVAPGYLDASVKRGNFYWYTVVAGNAAGRSPDSEKIPAGAGLATGWQHHNVGHAATGSATFDGRQFTVEGGGTGIGGTRDEFHFAWVPMTGDGEVTTRFVPQVASQLAVFGVMMRAGLEEGAAQAALVLAPAPAGPGSGRAGWQPKLLVRSRTDGNAVPTPGPNLPAPYVTYNRLMEPYWLRLERRGSTIVASVSPDGVTWTKVGEAEFPPGLEIAAGLAVCSALGSTTTVVRFDHVAVTSWKGAARQLSRIQTIEVGGR